VKAQGTMTKRLTITVKQQFRWHQAYENALNLLCKMSSGICQRTGKTFGEVIQHFVLGGDETCFQASDVSDAIVVAEHRNKKPEKKSHDCRDSITLYQTCTVSGSTGLTMFLMKGKTK
jgi:hypothetical protein